MIIVLPGVVPTIPKTGAMQVSNRDEATKGRKEHAGNNNFNLFLMSNSPIRTLGAMQLVYE